MKSAIYRAKPVPEIAAQYAEEVRKRLGGHVRAVILFGSQARGEATDASDYDFVVVVDKKSQQLREAVTDAGAAILNTTDRLCASLVYGEDQWLRVLSTPLGWNISREGVQL
jgi:predicted nucleotidyltransferase